VTHFCSFKVTHTENTIWNRILPTAKWATLSSTPKACGLLFHHPVAGRVEGSVCSAASDPGDAAALAPCFLKRWMRSLARRQAVPIYRWCWSLLASKVGSFLASAEAAFRDDPEHHRSVATLATRLCGKVFAFVKRNLSGAQRRMDAASGEMGAGKAAAALVPASAHRSPERD
jgi:hypothetical protein